ncbi:MAG: hypothetical protein EBQ53_08305 [Betaproteobacteria bacterium]|nr:hypothetical protein [Betaproteobacteria bacterium]
MVLGIGDPPVRWRNAGSRRGARTRSLALLLAFWALLRWSLPRLQRRDRWAVGLSLFSALSLAIPAHAAASELWTLAAFALLMAALTRPDRRWNRTAALVGAAIALAGLSGGAQALLIAVAT